MDPLNGNRESKVDPPCHTVLCVDDEKNILRSLNRLLRNEKYRLITAGSGAEALDMLARVPAQLVISDQRMPEMSGVEFLTQVKDLYPDILRIILSGYTDVDSITEAINKGHIYKFLLKPWNDENLKLEIRQALQQFDLIQDNRKLHEQVLRQLEELRRINETLEAMVQARTRELEFKNQALELSHAILEDVPYPVLGISPDGMVAFVNPRVRDLLRIGLNANPGDNIFECFPLEVQALFRSAFHQDAPARGSFPAGRGERCVIGVYPMSGRFRGKGVIAVVDRGAGG